MTINSAAFTFDANLELKDAGLVAASAAAQVDSADKIVDLGAGRVDARVILDVSALEVASTDEKYDIQLQGSNSATFASGIVDLGMLRMGNETSPISADTSTGRFELHFTNQQNGTTYRYVRLYTYVAGSIASGINYTGFIVKDT